MSLFPSELVGLLLSALLGLLLLSLSASPSALPVEPKVEIVDLTARFEPMAGLVDSMSRSSHSQTLYLTTPRSSQHMSAASSVLHLSLVLLHHLARLLALTPALLLLRLLLPLLQLRPLRLRLLPLLLPLFVATDAMGSLPPELSNS